MSLHLVLRAQTMVVGSLEIRRQEHYDGLPPDDSTNTYTVIHDGREIGEVIHRYGDGPWLLLALGAELTSRAT